MQNESTASSTKKNPTRLKNGKRLFLRAWLTAPRNVGAVVPSSRFLSRKIAAQIDAHHPGWVIELGAGTGVVTKALLEAGVKPERLLVVERDRRLCHMLEKLFEPRGVRVVRADACTLEELLKEQYIHKVNAVISSLPLLSLPKEVSDTVLQQIFTVLPPEGQMVQFTYGPKSPIPRANQKKLGINAQRAGRVILNIPPATVWNYGLKA